MERFYIDGDTARFLPRDMTMVDMQLQDGKVLEKLEPHRLFPVSDLDRYIILLDENGAEQGIIRDLYALQADQRELIQACLDAYYRIPKILRIREFAERHDGLTLCTDTDKGPADIEVRVLVRGFQLEKDGRVRIRDINDNRYEITDIRKMDKHSRQIMARYV